MTDRARLEMLFSCFCENIHYPGERAGLAVVGSLAPFRLRCGLDERNQGFDEVGVTLRRWAPVKGDYPPQCQ